MPTLLALVLSILVVPARAEVLRPLLLRREVEVRKEARVDRPVVLSLPEGEKIWIGDEEGEFTRVRLKRAGRWRRGFVFTEDLLAAPRAPAAAPADPRGIAVGVAANFSRMSQPGRHFQTTDMVQWTTSTYESHSVWPSLYAQFGRKDFWRLAFGLRLVDFKGAATVDVGVQNSRPIEVVQTMYSGRVEKGFNVLGPAYVSVGGEGARATSLTETLGGVTVPTTSADLGFYAGLLLGLGIELPFFGTFSGVGEARYAYFPSVKPAAQSIDFTLGLSCWF